MQVRDVRQVLSVWLSLWFLLLNVIAVPLCQAPSGLSFDGQAVVLCHAADDGRTGQTPDGSGPADGAAHCPLCFVCQMLSGGVPAVAPTTALWVPVPIGTLPLPGRPVLSPVRFAAGPQQPRAPPVLL